MKTSTEHMRKAFKPLTDRIADLEAENRRLQAVVDKLEIILGPGGLGQYFTCKPHPSGGWMLGPTLDRQVADQMRRDLFQDDDDQWPETTSNEPSPTLALQPFSVA